MIELFGDLSDWVVGFADSDWAVLVLAASSFAEAIFFPVPPDPLLIGIALIKPESALWLAALATVSSVAGAVVGHWLGRRFGRPLLYRLASEGRVATIEGLFKRYGGWAILIAAFTPLPYKLFAISAGILDLDRRTLIIASLVGRGARFFLLGGLIFFYKDEIEDFIETNFEVLTAAFTVGVVILVGIVLVYARHRRARDVMG